MIVFLFRYLPFIAFQKCKVKIQIMFNISFTKKRSISLLGYLFLVFCRNITVQLRLFFLFSIWKKNSGRWMIDTCTKASILFNRAIAVHWNSRFNSDLIRFRWNSKLKINRIKSGPLDFYRDRRGIVFRLGFDWIWASFLRLKSSVFPFPCFPWKHCITLQEYQCVYIDFLLSVRFLSKSSDRVQVTTDEKR